MLSYLPLAHAGDRFLSYYASLVTGHSMAFCLEVSQVLTMMLEVRPTLFGGVPRIWEKLHAGLTSAITKEPDEQRRRMVLGAIELSRTIVAMEQRGEPVPAELRQKRAMAEPIFAAIRARSGLDRVRQAVTGAAPTPREVLEFFHAIGIPINEIWGMSELGAMGTGNPPDRVKLGTIGAALPGVELRLGPDGELQVRGGLVMQGYYKDPEKTAETIDPDGWLSTGDIATVDAEGYYTIIDRKKELILPGEWTAESEELTPTLKLKRRVIVDKYAAEIEAMYAGASAE